MTGKEFIQKVIITDIGKMQDAGFYYYSFILMAQSIEVMGAFLDNKPLKADNQSSKRFNNALKELFHKQYFFLNKDYYLYNKLRNQMVHALIPSQELLLTTKDSGKKHLSNEDKKLVLVAETFYNDVRTAAEKLIYLIDNQKIKPKNLPVDIFI
ncbi:MAG: hypothetical protein A2W91_08065 [Bacteroidetes bacterium GWF2_38_335]|nr:MAG: hypothetical protein A2W91_08065 [Bacteroidetes bacterium GWF2_38_335]OFY78999.1 MAG: hypothetical protein A2281_02655 [Bacteroidetes bacterium RIFOXYA12_FULL_38_20]HBS86072.1 hypothetical protein [Bacteroidales bacterium]